MEQKTWTETDIAIDSVSWRGEPIHIKGVKALKNTKTGEIRVHPSEIAQAEIRQIAERLDLLPRDIGALLMILARPGYFKEGEVLFKYHLQKLLFYLWKYLDSCGYENSLPVDRFIAARNGPVPENLDDDLKRLETKKLIKVRYEKWAEGKSKRIILTQEGTKVAGELSRILPDPYKEIAVRVKERIHPLTPERVRQLVHNEYPEYKDTYVENDIE